MHSCMITAPAIYSHSINRYIHCSFHTDINECDTSNGGCSHVCTDTLGSFLCSCRSGFTLASDGTSCSSKIYSVTCSKILIIKLSHHFCFRDKLVSFQTSMNATVTMVAVVTLALTHRDHLHVAVIVDMLYPVMGRAATVSLLPTRSLCTIMLVLFPSLDINECNTNNGGCSHKCTDSEGSFRCGCTKGLTIKGGDGFNCNGKCSCYSIFTCTSASQTCLFFFQISTSVPLTGMTVVRYALTQWDRSHVAAEVDML